MKNCWTKLLRRIRLLRELRTPGQWWLFLRVFLFAATVPLLFCFKLSVLNAWLRRRAAVHDPPGADADAGAQIIRCVELATALGRPLVRARCLTRCATLLYFLRRAGWNLTLCFGAACVDGRLEEAPGHCWLVEDGKPFLEEKNPGLSFVPIYSIPEPTAISARKEPST